MARYRKVSTKIWNDAKFTALSDDAKLAFLCTLTHPHMTPLGAMRATMEGIAAELGWPSERLREAFREAIGKGLVKVDENAKCVSLPNFVKHNMPESPNVVKAWGKCADDIPECEIKNQAIQAATGFLDDTSEPFRKASESLREAFPKAFAKGMPNQEQEQEQEQEPKNKTLDHLIDDRAVTTEQPGKTEPRTETETKPKTPKGLDRFDEFWQAYPRKTNKKAARQKWANMKLDSKADEIISNVKARITRDPTWTKDGGQFIPHASTYLNGERWEDELEPGRGQGVAGASKRDLPGPLKGGWM